MVKSTALATIAPPAASPSIGSAPGRIGSSAIRDVLALAQRPEVISLAGGLPNPATFPIDAIADATAAVLAADPIAALQYGPTEGDAGLRSVIARRADVDPATVLVTSGSQQALDLVARALLDPGDVAVVADPAYVGALQALRASDAHLVAIRSDRGGLRVDDLASLLADGLRPKLVHVVAEFDNPTGATLTPERRVALAELADRYGFWIVDDDPYGDLRWRGARPTALSALSDRVVSLGSASKVLCPGLRVGWLIAPSPVVDAVTVLKQAADLHSGSLAQRVAASVLGDDQTMAAHLGLLRATYRRQADALVDALDRHLPGALELRRPDGGMFVWARLADDVAPGASSVDLLTAALDAGVAFVPGPAFAATPIAIPAGDHGRWLRLSFATAEPDALDEAARRLASALPSP